MTATGKSGVLVDRHFVAKIIDALSKLDFKLSCFLVDVPSSNGRVLPDCNPIRTPIDVSSIQLLAQIADRKYILIQADNIDNKYSGAVVIDRSSTGRTLTVVVYSDSILLRLLVLLSGSGREIHDPARYSDDCFVSKMIELLFDAPVVFEDMAHTLWHSIQTLNQKSCSVFLTHKNRLVREYSAISPSTKTKCHCFFVNTSITREATTNKMWLFAVHENNTIGTDNRDATVLKYEEGVIAAIGRSFLE